MSAQARPGELLALDLPAGPASAEAIREAWEAGVAVLPLDPRLPAADREALLRRARPAVVRRRDGSERRPDAAPIDDDVALVVATSGTEGEPRLVELPRAAVLAAISTSREALGAPADAAWLCPLPTAHVGGLLVVLRAVVGGGTVETLPRFDVDAVARSLARWTSLVPTMLRRLVEAGAALDRFDGILVGGAGLDPDARAAAGSLGARIVETYGCTESCGGIVYDGHPIPGTGVGVRADGRIVLSGPTLFRRYRGDRAATAAAFDADGALVTRDVGRIDAEARLEILGRADDAIATGGETVHPLPVERALAAHPGVADVAVAGIPDPEWGERVVAFVVPRDPAAPPTEDELRAFAREALPPWAVPRQVVLRPDLPRTPSGKVRRRALREQPR